MFKFLKRIFTTKTQNHKENLNADYADFTDLFKRKKQKLAQILHKNKPPFDFAQGKLRREVHEINKGKLDTDFANDYLLSLLSG